ncbi:MAG: hypothetical protein M3442_18140 [Chloroflexota bacterium]|nr:hypothetical protein [Chloroflexota bacterium]
MLITLHLMLATLLWGHLMALRWSLYPVAAPETERAPSRPRTAEAAAA